MNLQHLDLEVLREDLDQLYRETLAKVGQDDLQHLRRIDRWLRILRFVGLAPARVAINPISILLLCMANTGRWAMPGHGAYDKVEGSPKRFFSLSAKANYPRRLTMAIVRRLTQTSRCRSSVISIFQTCMVRPTRKGLTLPYTNPLRAERK